MAHIVSNELFVADDDVQAFEDNFSASMKGTLGDVPGLLGARLLRPLTAGSGYLSVLAFEDEAAYEAYLTSEAFAAAHNWPEHAPFERSRLTTYETMFVLGD